MATSKSANGVKWGWVRQGVIKLNKLFHTKFWGMKSTEEELQGTLGRRQSERSLDKAHEAGSNMQNKKLFPSRA